MEVVFFFLLLRLGGEGEGEKEGEGEGECRLGKSFVIVAKLYRSLTISLFQD